VRVATSEEKGKAMEPERSARAPREDIAAWPALGWQATLFIGAASVILGLIVAFHPTGSLNVIAVLLGILMIFSGIFHIVDAVGGAEQGRVWRGIAGILFIVGGTVLIRHLHLSLALIGLVIGLTWVVQGVIALLAGFSAGRGAPGGWWPVVFGVVSLAAGIIVISTPVGSVTTLATLMGIWFVVMGVFEMAGAIVFRRALRPAGTGPVNVPGQRPGGRPATNNVPGGSPAPDQKIQG
jgi:uncharacterized membrane protein HdeD (DUF308 family)